MALLKKMLIALTLLAVVVPAQAQTTGKIKGRITDSASNAALPGANIVVLNTSRGAAADENGEFYILNLPPGKYSLRVQMIGYESVLVQDVRVSVNRTAAADVQMKEAAIAGEEVVVTADRIAVKKDQTSSIRNVSSDQIDILPIESIGAVVQMQPGVVAGHFRGGRSNEVSYLIDGLQVDEGFGGEGTTVDLEPEAIQDLEVITGTFNAEYGRAMSGIVNAVTKSGGSKFHGSFSSEFGSYYTNAKDTFGNQIFVGEDELSDFDRNQDYRFQLSGPIWGDKLTFFTNFRYQDYKNHLNGIRRFNVTDSSNFDSSVPFFWYSEATGDSAFVPMNNRQNNSFMAKITARPFSTFRMSFLFTLNDDEWNGYNHGFKYNPDGTASSFRESYMYSLQFNHLISETAFWEGKFSQIDNTGSFYLFEDPTDPRYVHDKYLYNNGPGFFTGGQEKSHSVRQTITRNAKLDLTWQVNKNHGIKAGILATEHDIDNAWSQIRNVYFGVDGLENLLYEPTTFPNESIYSDIYKVKPRELAAYFQDKIEFNEMVINLGLRYDYFDPATTYPSQRRNPANQLSFPDNPEKMSTPVKADTKTQLSPRFGLSYQLSDVALLRFSYGHFFQMPPMAALYENNAHFVAPTDYATTMGNPQINPQKTVQYEIGLWQELIEGMGLEVALFYRDIYDLQSALVLSTFNQIEYGLYGNKDYGNAKGLEVKYDYLWRNFTARLNYTLQYTRGNADNPQFTFSRAGDSRDPVPTLIPMSWDQRHTMNVTVGYNQATYGMTATAYYNSGTAFTWSPLDINRLSRVNLLPNNAYKPSTFSTDLRAYYNLGVVGNVNLKLNLSVFNLFDRRNEDWVDARTGRAYTSIITESERSSHRSNFNEYEDRIRNPSMFSAPRLVKLGLGVTF